MCTRLVRQKTDRRTQMHFKLCAPALFVRALKVEEMKSRCVPGCMLAACSDRLTPRRETPGPE